MTIGVLWQTGASALLLLPVAIVVMILAVRCTRHRFGVSTLFWIPAAIAMDVLSWLLLSRVVAFEVAVLVSRIAWIALGLFWMHRNRRLVLSLKYPWREIAYCLAIGAAAFAFSASMSRPYSLWDRQFHMPVVTALRGQGLPFITPFQPNTVLHYHFGADVFAAGLQVLSGNRIHASLALALEHDICFGLIGVSIGAWLTSSYGIRAWIALAPFAIFLMGPFSLLRAGLGSPMMGYSYLSFLCISFRPSVVFACLLLCGIAGALLAQIERSEPPGWVSQAALAVVVAVLGITDESSTVLVLGALGVTWIFYPRPFAARRIRGVLLFVVLIASMGAANLVFQAALAPGGPVQKVLFAPWRLPQYGGGTIAPSAPKFWLAALTDWGPYALVLVGSISVGVRQSSARLRRLSVFLFAMMAASLICVMRLDVNGNPMENHRFLTVCEVLFPIVGIAALAALPSGRWERIAVLAALVLSASSSFYWYQLEASPPEEFFTSTVNCRRSAGAQLFERPRPTYVERSRFFEFTGCRPVFTPGTMEDWGALYTGAPAVGRGAFSTLSNEFVSPRESLRAICPAETTASDPVCAYAVSRGLCVPNGKAFRSCELSHDDRSAILAAWP